MSDNEREKRIRNAVEEYGDFLYRLAVHYVKSSADAEDVVQEVLLAYLVHAEHGRERGKGWFVRVTVNKCLDLLRKRKRMTDKQFDESLLPASAPENTDLYAELLRLSPLDREIVYLHYYAGYTTKEIAGMLHRTDSSVRKRLERAKKQLKTFLEESL